MPDGGTGVADGDPLSDGVADVAGALVAAAGGDETPRTRRAPPSGTMTVEPLRCSANGGFLV